MFNILIIIYHTFFIVFICIFFLEIPRWTVHFVHGWRQDVKKINEVTPISNFLRTKRADHLYNFQFFSNFQIFYRIRIRSLSLTHSDWSKSGWCVCQSWSWCCRKQLLIVEWQLGNNLTAEFLQFGDTLDLFGPSPESAWLADNGMSESVNNSIQEVRLVLVQKKAKTAWKY